jgi:hypothetical protein
MPQRAARTNLSDVLAIGGASGKPDPIGHHVDSAKSHGSPLAASKNVACYHAEGRSANPEIRQFASPKRALFWKAVSLGNLLNRSLVELTKAGLLSGGSQLGVAWSLNRKLRRPANDLCVDRKSISNDKSPSGDLSTRFPDTKHYGVYRSSRLIGKRRSVLVASSHG